MNKKLIISLATIGAVAVIAGGVTYALFSDTETSTGNIFTAGTVDLKVDHLKQTYNGMNCETCSLVLYSDANNTWVVDSSANATVQVPPTFLAPLVSSPHPNWATHGTAKWIWAQPSTSVNDSGNIDVEYTFERNFYWNGVPGAIDFQMSLASDNGYAIYVNGTELVNKLGEEFNYNAILQPLDTLETEFKNALNLGNNKLTIIVRNHALPGGTPSTNPGGLLYYLSIVNNECQNDYGFQQACRLWVEKDLDEGDTFFNFGDVKPGDWGTNVISLHVYGNNAYSCLLVTNPQDNGELSQYLKAFVWIDSEKDGNYDPGETVLYGPNLLLKDINGMARILLTATTTENIGLAWCMGTQSVDLDTGIISCSGAGNQNAAQGDSFTASLTAYAEQQRNNEGFTCASVSLGVCGNGTTEQGEQCDDGNSVDTDTCTNACQINQNPST